MAGSQEGQATASRGANKESSRLFAFIPFKTEAPGRQERGKGDGDVAIMTCKEKRGLDELGGLWCSTQGIRGATPPAAWTAHGM